MLKGYFLHAYFSLIICLAVCLLSWGIAAALRLIKWARVLSVSSRLLFAGFVTFYVLGKYEVEWFVGCFFEEDTCYATAYTDAAFSRIAPLQSKADVTSLLGEPLRKWTSKKCHRSEAQEYWYYSGRGPRFKHYKMRIVCFDPAGRVKRIETGFLVLN